MKVLIYLPQEELKPVGGPLGVGYNIKMVLEQENIQEIEFLHIKRKKNRHGKIITLFKWIFSYITMFIFPNKENLSLFQKYDIVHFHSVKDFYTNRNALKKYKGKTVLTSHSPEPMALEMYKDITSRFIFLKSKWLLNQLRKMDYYSFNNADYVLFPVEDAEEPYLNNWLDFGKIKSKRQSHFFYCPTGIVPVKEKRSKQAIMDEFGIGPHSFVICYVGRHNEIKGFDSLKRIGKKLLEEESAYSFIICGKEYPINGLQHDRWTEIGWTNDAYSYIAASDLFILPNKETYFDLIMLEALSLGKIVVASRTGGNKYFEKNSYPGVLLYDSEEECISIVHIIKKMSKEDRLKLGEANKRLFLKDLTAKVFVENYINLLNKIYDKASNQLKINCNDKS